MTNSEQNFLIEYSRFLDSSGIHLTYSAISTFLNEQSGPDRLSRKERAFLQDHLGSCPACRAIAEEVREVEGISEGKNRTNILSFIPQFIRYPAAAVMMVGIGLSMYVLMDERRPEQRNNDEHQISRSVTETVPDASHFVPNRTLENFIGRTYRSSEQIYGFTPSPGDTVTNPVRLRWNGKNPSANTTISIVDNENRERWRKNIAASEITVDTILPPGLYYIKLEPNARLRYVGKFIIGR